MTMKKRNLVVLALAAVMVASLAASAVASAAPAWKFNGTELTGKETIVGAAISSSLTIPGATTTCEHFLYNMKIWNTGGTGEGEITELPLYECKASGECSVKSIEAEKLPWPTHLTTVAGKDYLIVEKVSVGIVYSGELCALLGEKVHVSGTAGGVINNTAQTATFDKATFEATKTALKVGSTVVEWNGEFPTEAFEAHREQALEG
jgi:hypothetical protein